MAKQINIFVENKPGRLQAVTNLLRENSINMRAMTIQDRSDFGIMKIIVDKPLDAHIVLTEAGFAAALKEILAIEMDDKPGGLDAVFSIFSQNDINIQDSYGFVIDSNKLAVFCIEVPEPGKVKKLLESKGINVLDSNQLYGL